LITGTLLYKLSSCYGIVFFFVILLDFASYFIFFTTVLQTKSRPTLKFVGVFGGVAEIFWNMTPLHWVVVPDVANQRIVLIFKGENGREEAKKTWNFLDDCVVLIRAEPIT
jgi:hypothetical protein